MKKFVMSSKCPRNLKKAPPKPCPLALQRLENVNKGCEWHINDKKSKYCFWVYMHRNNNRSHTVTEISRLWNTSLNNVSIAERTALNKLLKRIL